MQKAPTPSTGLDAQPTQCIGRQCRRRWTAIADHEDPWRGSDGEVAETKEANTQEIINIRLSLITYIAYYIVIGRHSIESVSILYCVNGRYSVESISIKYVTIDRYDVTAMANQ